MIKFKIKGYFTLILEMCRKAWSIFSNLVFLHDVGSSSVSKQILDLV